MWLRCFKGACRWLWYSIAAVIILFAIFITSARAAFPILNRHKDLFAHLLAHTLHHPVKLSKVQLGWRGLNPQLRFSGITVYDEASHNTLLQIDHFNLGISTFSSLLHRSLLPNSLEIDGAKLSLYEQQNHMWLVSGKGEGNLGSLKEISTWMLTQPRITLRNLNFVVHYLNGSALQIKQLQARVTQEITPMLAGNFKVGPNDGHVNFVWKWLGNNGRSMFYLQVLNVNSEPWLQPTLNLLNIKSTIRFRGALSGRFWVDTQDKQVEQIRADINHSTLNLENAHYFKMPLTLHDISTELFWQKKPGFNELHISALRFFNQRAQDRAAFVMRFYHFPKTYIETIGHFSLADVSVLKAWIPSILSPHLHQWLAQAFLKGSINNAKFSWLGRAHHFSLHLPLHHVNFRFSPDWPMIKKIDGVLDFNNKGLYISVDRGDILGNHLQNTVTMIPNLAQPKLYVDGKVDGLLKNGLLYLQKSPLPLAPFVKGWQAAGNMSLHLKLGIDLTNKHYPVESKGQIQFHKASLFLPGTFLKWTNINGELLFYDTKMTAKKVQGKFYGAPVSLKVKTAFHKHKPIYKLNFNGMANLNDHYFVGKTPYHALLQLSLLEKKPSMIIDADSNLQGLKSLLPDPLAKSAAEHLPLQFHLGLVPGRPNDLSLTLGDRIVLATKYLKSNMAIRILTGALSIGKNKESLHLKQGQVNAHIDLPTLNIDRWLEDWHQFRKNYHSPVAKLKLIVPWNTITLKLSHVTYRHHAINNTHARLQKEQKNWRIMVKSDLLKGLLFVPYASDAPWRAQFDYCSLPKWWHASGDTDPRQLPSLNFKCHHFYYHGRYWGEFDLITQRQHAGLKIKSLQVYTRRFGIAANGGWLAVPHVATHLKGKLKANDLGGLLQRFGVGHVIDQGYGEASFNLLWPSSPASAKMANVSGDLNFEFRAGRILKLSKEAESNLGLGRFLNLLSLQSLPFTVFSGFQTLGAKGFQFELLKGAISLHNGYGTIQNMSLVGPVAWIRASGGISFKDQRYDLHLDVIPNITSSLPLIVGLAGGPLAGAIAWVANQILGSQIGKAAEKVFHIQGSWKHPNVVKLPMPKKTHTG